MKLNTTRTVDNNLGDMETHRVSIAANGKAFSTLVKGIYENKIRAFVREIATNALDSHIQAGIEDTQFHVSFPDIFDPYFRVRDYGVSMTHEQVFAIFGTLFESTKDDSNDVVGAFGLGSKSPLAYADSFNVTAFLDDEMRVYLVTIDETGAPTISLLATESSDKPDGIEVAVPIREQDFSRVTSEGRDVLSAFDVLPTSNITLEGLNKLYTLEDGSAFVCKTTGYQRLIVRQGCVMYPVSDWDIVGPVQSVLPASHAIVLDVPIGTVGVTTSREALELDEKTRAFLKDTVAQTVANIQTELTEIVNSMPNMLSANQYLFGNDSLRTFWLNQFQFRNRTVNGYLELAPSKGKRWQRRVNEFECYAQVGTSRQRRNITRFHVNDAAQLTIVTDYDSKDVPRSTMRYRDFVNSQPKDSVIRLTNPSRKQLARLVRLLGLNKEQIVWIGSLPDPGPTKRGERRNTSSTVQGVKEGANAISTLPEKYYWVSASRPDYYERQRYDSLRREVIDMGGDVLPMLIFTPSAVKRYKPDTDFQINNVRKNLLADNKDSIYENWILHVATSGFSTDLLNAIDVEIDHKDLDKITLLFDNDEIAEMNQKAKDMRLEWREQYPLLIDTTPEDWQEYIRQCSSDK